MGGRVCGEKDGRKTLVERKETAQLNDNLAILEQFWRSNILEARSVEIKSLAV
jgi:hypothetical protein